MHSYDPGSFGARIGQRALQELRSSGVPRPFLAREPLFMERDPSAGVFLIESGLIKIHITASDGTELILGIYGRDELLCELSALERSPRSASGTGRANGMVTEIPGAVFRAFVGRHPEALQHVLATVRHRLQRADQERLSYLSDGVRMRVVRKLLTWAGRFGDRTAEGLVVSGFSRRDLAQSVAANEKTVDSILSSLAAEGVLTTSRERFLLLDVELLRKWTET